MRHPPGCWVPRLLPPAVAATIALGAAGCAEESPTDLYELSGIVTDESTSDPVDGATVTFTSDTLYSEETKTDSDGEYEMVVESDVEFGQVRADKAGYEPRERTVFFDTRVRRIDLVIRPSGSM